MFESMKSKFTLNIVFASISTALVCVATMLFQVYVPATRGFFNIGESMVFLSALLFGPFVGAFAGGIGSMLADLLLGYYYYAPLRFEVYFLYRSFLGNYFPYLLFRLFLVH